MPTVGTSSRGHRLRARNLVDDMDLRRSAAIAIGATAGAGIRWALTRALGPGAVDVSLLTVNLVGAMLLGALTGARPGSVSARTQGLIGAGLCGGLTTWSALAVHTATEYRAGSWLAPSAWLVANLLGGTAVAVAGRMILQRTWRDEAEIPA